MNQAGLKQEDMAGKVEAEIAALADLDLDALKTHWVDLFKVPPPHRIRQDFLQRAIAYRIQVNAFGGLKPATRRQLKRIASDLKAGRPVQPSPAPVLAPGTKLMREWQGRMETVEVTESGFVWAGQTYPSLSAAACAITGTRWSGPKFFGLATGKTERRP